VVKRELKTGTLATGELRTVDGLGHRHVVELAARPDGGALAAMPSAMSPSPRLPLCIVT
jgi:hypothetical protein